MGFRKVPYLNFESDSKAAVSLYMVIFECYRCFESLGLSVLVAGTPWFVAATVAAITHVQTLRRVSEVTAPGEKPVFIGARLGNF